MSHTAFRAMGLMSKLGLSRVVVDLELFEVRGKPDQFPVIEAAWAKDGTRTWPFGMDTLAGLVWELATAQGIDDGPVQMHATHSGIRRAVSDPCPVCKGSVEFVCPDCLSTRVTWRAKDTVTR